MKLSSTMWRFSMLAFFILGCFFFLPRGRAVHSAPAAEAGIRVITSDVSRIVFEVSTEAYRFKASESLDGFERLIIPGFETASEPGEPAIPSQKLLIALPPWGSYSVSTRILKVRNLGRHRLEPVPIPLLIDDGLGGSLLSQQYKFERQIYSSYEPEPVVVADSVVFIRHQRVLPVRVNPVQYNALSSEMSLYAQIRVEIVFETPRDDEIRNKMLWKPVAEAPSWERILSRTVLNPRAAAKWRMKRRPALETGLGSREAAPAVLSGPLVKLKVKQSDVHRVKASSLIARGFPSGQNISGIRLFKRHYDEGTMTDNIIDTGFIIREDSNGVPGVFEGNDYLVFYGLSLGDDSRQEDSIEKFADHNIYWLGADLGTAMPRVSLKRGYVSQDTLSASFQVLERYEEDVFFQDQTPEPGQGEPPLLQDSFFANDPLASSLSLPFDVHAIKPGTALEIQAEFIGGNLANTTLRELQLSIVNGKGSVPLNSVYISGNNRVHYVSQLVAAADLEEGTNTLSLAPPEAGRNTLAALLNWFSVQYTSLYRARGDALDFHTASLTGDTSITITGLSRKDLLLFDVTDSLNARECILDDSLFVNSAGDIVLSFREQLSTRKQYILTPFESIHEIDISEIISDSPSNIIGNPMEGGADVLVVSHSDYLSEMQRWVDYRRAQGYRVFVVDVEDVFDEFNGGVPNAAAVKRFIRHYFEKAGASFVLLVGDASEDTKRVHQDSGINFVPSQSYPERIQSAPFNEDEVVTSDKWYVLMDNDYLPGQSDYYPDLIIGRLPAGEVRELKTMLDKIFAFEKPSASDFWRRRMIQIADDSWSTAGYTGQTCFRPSELGFEQGEEDAAEIMDSSLAGGFEVVRQYLSKHTSVVHPVNSGCVDDNQVKSYTRAYALPELLGEIQNGATLISIQAHMNRYLITHEWLFTSSSAIGRDHYRLQNFGKPFVVFGMGCHLSDYAVHRELARHVNNDVNGDCIDEILLFLNNRGAVATYGSSGFEYLGENVIFTKAIYETFFNNPPLDTMVATDKAQARWIFGELITVSEIMSARSGQVKRYHILGDPLLRIDAGPPRFEVKLNGTPVNSGVNIDPEQTGDSLYVEAVISDENAIEDFFLEIDGKDESGSMTVIPLVDTNLSAARKYRVDFSHGLMPKPYDIILRALQVPDTTAGEYNIAAEFVLKVPFHIEMKVNGRSIFDGEVVPADGNYSITLDLPVYVDPTDIEVEVDGSPVISPAFNHPTPGDSTSWIIDFSQSFSVGEHAITISVVDAQIQDLTVLMEYNVRVSSRAGIRQLITFPNPFSQDTYFVFDNDVPIEDGHIDIFTSSGRRIASLTIPFSSRMPGQNAIYWDGNDFMGERVANGVYLYIITVVQNGERHTLTGKIACIK